MNEGRKERKEGRKEGKERRKGTKEGRKGKKEGTNEGTKRAGHPNGYQGMFRGFSFLKCEYSAFERLIGFSVTPLACPGEW